MKYRTNSKHVTELVKSHILNELESMTDEEQTEVELLKANIKALIWGNRETYEAINDYIDGGAFLIYHDDVKNFLNGLGINPDNKEYDSQDSWNLYKLLLSREIEKLIK